MFSQRRHLEYCMAKLAKPCRALVELSVRNADFLIRWCVAAGSLIVFGMISLITGIGGIFVFGLVPILVFEYARGP